MRRFGRNLGFSYQIADDCLDFLPSSAPLNKDRLIDLRNGVPNYPLLLAARDGCLRSALRRGLAAKLTEAQVEHFGDLMRRSSAMRKASRRAGRFLKDARKDLDAIRRWGNGRSALMIEDYLEEQSRDLTLIAQMPA